MAVVPAVKALERRCVSPSTVISRVTTPSSHTAQPSLTPFSCQPICTVTLCAQTETSTHQTGASMLAVFRVEAASPSSSLSGVQSKFVTRTWVTVCPCLTGATVACDRLLVKWYDVPPTTREQLRLAGGSAAATAALDAVPFSDTSLRMRPIKGMMFPPAMSASTTSPTQPLCRTSHGSVSMAALAAWQ
jgi:hypothetical protein